MKKYRIKEVRFPELEDEGATPTYYVQRRVGFWWVDHQRIQDHSTSSGWLYRSAAVFKDLDLARDYMKQLQKRDALKWLCGKKWVQPVREQKIYY